jgi:hypothetical protein
LKNYQNEAKRLPDLPKYTPHIRDLIAHEAMGFRVDDIQSIKDYPRLDERRAVIARITPVNQLDGFANSVATASPLAPLRSRTRAEGDFRCPR